MGGSRVRRGGRRGEEPLQDLLGFTSPWKRSPLSWGDRLGNLWSLCGLGVGKGVPASAGGGASRGFESAARLWGFSPFLLIPTSQRRKLRPQEGHSLAQDHTHIPFRASQDLSPRPSGLRACALGAQGDEGGAVTVPASTEDGRGTDRLHPSPEIPQSEGGSAHPLPGGRLGPSPPLGRRIPE